MNTSPKIVTFYSYKGGVGRSMALANVAWLLAKEYKVLVVDWDLDAPGLHKFFGIPDKVFDRGLIDIFYDYKNLLRTGSLSLESELTNINDYIKKISNNFGNGSISILPAGRLDNDYATRVNSFDWDDFYEIWHGYGFIEYLKEQFKNKADFILIDSRTGITDIGGICTLQMPDAVVLLHSLNEQSIQGTEKIIKNIKESFKSSAESEFPKLIIVPSRVEKYLEKERLKEWSEKAAQTLGCFIENNLYGDVIEYINEILIPDVPYYTFGEELAVIIDPADDMAKAYNKLTKTILKTLDYPLLKDDSVEFKLDSKSKELMNVTKLIDNLMETKKDNCELWVTKGIILSQLEMFKEAINSFDEALKTKPDLSEAWFNKATILTKLDKNEEALEAYTKYLELKPEHIEFWFNKGNILLSLDRKEEALVAYNKVTVLDPDYPEVWTKKGIVLSSLGRYEEALEAYDKVIPSYPDSPQVWFNKGTTLFLLGRKEEALEVYERAINLKPDYAEAWFNKGVVLSSLGRNDESLEAYNQLMNLPPNSIELKKLNELDISVKKLSNLPPEIAKFKFLLKLNISKNQLKNLPPEIVELKELIELNISGNQFKSMPSEITKLRNLEKLIVSDNHLIDLPDEITELKNLRELNVSGNQLTDLQPLIKELKNLNKLVISNNQLVDLPHEIVELKNLTELDVSGNQLKTLPHFIKELKSLNKLNLSGNQLKSLPDEIAKLEYLVELDVSENQIINLPPEILELKNLQKLDVSENKLTILPFEIVKTNLDIEWNNQLRINTIYLKNNPFENPPVEIVKQGKDAVADYFKSFESEPKSLKEVKVHLLGEGAAGKTSLLKRLVGEGFSENEQQTQGIRIQKWNVKDGNKDIILNFWDFGGQEIMHATHQLFLSKRSLYILVLDGRKDEKSEYWLKLIENFGGDSPILVVINKIDENPAFELNRRFLQEKYHSIKGFFRLSCKFGEGVDEFSKALKEEIMNIRNLEIKWPRSWFNVKNKLERMRTTNTLEYGEQSEHYNFIQYKEYKMICEKEGIKDESKQNTLVDFLHDFGVILHFRDISLLGTIVLEPLWITNAIYKIINSEYIVESRGILKLDMLSDILKQSNEKDLFYPPDQYGFIVSLMKKFELSYDLDESTVLLPDLLEIQKPEFEIDYEEALKFVIVYDFLPRSIMPRFIVKMHRDIKNDLRWRTGVVLVDNNFNSTAVVISDNEARRISIYVNGRQKRDYFAVILQKFREINNSFEKLKATEKIPLPDKPEVTVSYEHLIKLELRGVDTYLPDGSDNEYKVSELLGTVTGKNDLIDILEILQKTEMNEKEILKTLQDLQKIESDSYSEEDLLEKLNKTIIMRPNILGVGPNINEMIRLYLKRKKRRS